MRHGAWSLQKQPQAIVTLSNYTSLAEPFGISGKVFCSFLSYLHTQREEITGDIA
jgi:hypothetical protein